MAEPLCCSAETLLIGYTAGQNKKLKKKNKQTKKPNCQLHILVFRTNLTYKRQKLLGETLTETTHPDQAPL